MFLNLAKSTLKRIHIKQLRKCYTQNVKNVEGSISQRRAVILNGVRTPFSIQSEDMWKMESYELAAAVIRGVIEKNKIKNDDIGMCIFGTTIQKIENANIARDSVLYSGLSASIPAYTTSMGVSSSLPSVSSAADSIRMGNQDSIIVGGVEILSDAPYFYSRERRKAIIKYLRDKSKKSLIENVIQNAVRFNEYDTFDLVDPLTQKNPIDIAIDVNDMFEEIRELKSYYIGLYTTNSYTKAEYARKNGLLSDVIPIQCRGGKLVEKDIYDEHMVDNSYVTLNPFIDDIPDQNMMYNEPPQRRWVAPNRNYKAKLEYFPKCCDGAAATILMSEEKALAKGLKPLAYFKDYLAIAKDPRDVGPFSLVESIVEIINRNNLSIDDISIIELHESSTIETLANIYLLKKSLAQDGYFKLRTNHTNTDILIEDRINVWGGSLAFGDPFGATGLRMINMACNQLSSSNGKYAIVASTSLSGMASSILLERYDSN